MDLIEEDLVRLSELAASLPWKPTRCTVWKWTTTGFRGTVLESFKLGGRNMTSKQAVNRFFARTGIEIEVRWNDQLLTTRAGERTR